MRPRNNQVVDWTVFVDEPFFDSYANIELAMLAYKTVLSDVGANQPVIDEHDLRMIDETFNGTYTYTGSKTGKLGLIDRETDAGGYEYYPLDVRGADYDTDQDGMPDWWERIKGLNPAVADNNVYSEANGYTALEEYLNWIAEPNFKVVAGMENTVVKLKTLFAGFKDNLYYNIIGVPSGYVAEEKDGELCVTPPANVNELVTLQIVVGDEDEVGQMTRNINLCVTSDASGIDLPFNLNDNHSTSYQIYSLNGILLKKGNDTSSLLPGVYIMKVINENSVKSLKFVKR